MSLHAPPQIERLLALHGDGGGATLTHSRSLRFTLRLLRAVLAMRRGVESAGALSAAQHTADEIRDEIASARMRCRYDISRCAAILARQAPHSTACGPARSSPSSAEWEEAVAVLRKACPPHLLPVTPEEMAALAAGLVRLPAGCRVAVEYLATTSALAAFTGTVLNDMAWDGAAGLVSAVLAACGVPGHPIPPFLAELLAVCVHC